MEVKNTIKKKVKKKNVTGGGKPAKPKGHIADFFGANPGETDGLMYQKNIRKEWD